MTKPFDIPKALLWEAFKCVKANGGAAGVDRESIEQFESRLGDNLYKLWNRLCSGSYFPPPVKGCTDSEEVGWCACAGRAHGCRSGGADGGQAPAGAADRPDVPSKLLWLSAWALCPRCDCPGEAAKLGLRLGCGIRYQGSLRPYRPRPAHARAQEALPDLMGAPVRGALAESAHADCGRGDSGTDVRHAARRRCHAPYNVA
jgi:hypothetical protein